MAHEILRITEVALDGTERPIDCFAFVKGIVSPWHKLGQAVDREVGRQGRSDRLLLEAARGDFLVEKAELCHFHHGRPMKVEGSFVTRRADTGRSFGVVSDRYNVIQNADLYGIAEGVTSRLDNAGIITCGVLHGGATFFVQVDLGVRFEPLPGDEHQQHLLLTSGHDGKRGWTTMTTDTQVVCANTLASAMSGVGLKAFVKHDAKADDIQKQMAETADLLQAVVRQAERLDSTYQQLASITMADRAAQRFLDKLEAPPLPLVAGALPEDVEQYDRDLLRVKKIHQGVMESALDGAAARALPAIVGTAYGWLAGVTDYTTHKMRSRSRISSTLYGNGADMNKKALAILANADSMAECLDA